MQAQSLLHSTMSWSIIILVQVVFIKCYHIPTDRYITPNFLGELKRILI